MKQTEELTDQNNVKEDIKVDTMNNSEDLEKEAMYCNHFGILQMLLCRLVLWPLDKCLNSVSLSFLTWSKQ